jgi:hypothetical protein
MRSHLTVLESVLEHALTTMQPLCRKMAGPLHGVPHCRSRIVQVQRVWLLELIRLILIREGGMRVPDRIHVVRHVRSISSIHLLPSLPHVPETLVYFPECSTIFTCQLHLFWNITWFPTAVLSLGSNFCGSSQRESNYLCLCCG